jgi:S1-C subfamily serine protease
MTTCPQCGYERKETDNIIGEDECPKCRIIYKKWKPASAKEDAASLENQSGKVPLPIRPYQSNVPDTGETKAKVILTIIVAAAIVIIGGHYLFSSLWTNKPSAEKSKINDIGQSNPGSDANTNQQPLTNSEVKTGETKQPYATGNNIAKRESMSAADLFRKSSRSVIIVQTQKGMGSGFFINVKGHIVTNKHVLTDLKKAEIKTVSGSIYKINEIIAEDASGDLVIATTEAPAFESIPVNLTSQLPEVGEKVIVIGNPLGLEQTLADGIVSSIRANQLGVNYIQVTAPISSGNSGGPLLNMYGEVIGVATFQYRQGQNLNFCVAAERIVTLQNGTAKNSGASQTAGQKELYCYADAQAKLYFVDWRTGVQVLRPDGSLDREIFEKYAQDRVGGNPMSIDPGREAQNALDENKEKMFKDAFPKKSVNFPDLTAKEQRWWENRQNQFYNDVYNKAVRRRHEATVKLNYMLQQFDRYSSTRNQLK